MNLLYPGQVEFDGTGKMTELPYDMTYEQFLVSTITKLPFVDTYRISI